MSELWFNLEWFGLLIGAVIAYALGWLWYSGPVFGDTWLAERGKKPKAEYKMRWPILLQALNTLFRAVLLALLYEVAFIFDVGYIGLLLVFMLPVLLFQSLAEAMYGGETMRKWRIDFGYRVLEYAVIAAVIMMCGYYLG